MVLSTLHLLRIGWLLSGLAFARADYQTTNSSSIEGANDPFYKHTLTAKGINATFIGYGATLTSLMVKDKHGNYQDVVVGYDDPKQYYTNSQTNHTFFGPVVGRYANRIKNGTFTIDGKTSHVPANEHNGNNTLHGGKVGYDQRNWTVTALSTNSITFTFLDNGLEGFPGDVLNVATYTLGDDASWTSRLVSIAMNQATPIMLSNHNYWNLGAFATKDAMTVLNDTLYMPYASRIINTDGILVPNGNISTTKGGPFDFTTAKPIGRDIPQLHDSCGTGCQGYDNAFILDRPLGALEDSQLEVLRLHSNVTGIQLSIRTNAQGIQIYSCVGQNGSIAVKKSQQHNGNSTTYVEKSGCLVIEPQDWIDGVNQPQWGRDQWQIFSATTSPAVNMQKYTFSVVE